MSPPAAASPNPPDNLLSNARWNLVGFACGIAANFITVPFVVNWIGLSAFGQAGLVLAITAPLTLIGTVIGQALVREVSSQLRLENSERVVRTNSAALKLCLVAGAIGWVALVLAGPWITVALLTNERISPGLTGSFLIAASGWFAQQLALVLQADSVARQDFRTVARCALVSAIATVAATLAMTAAIPTVNGYLAGVAASFGLTLLTWAWVRRDGLQFHSIAASNLVVERRALIQFGKWQGLAQLAGAFGNQIDRYALAALAPVALVGQYNVANRLQEAAYIGVVKAGEVLFPYFGSLASESTTERVRVFQVTSWVVGTFSAMLLVPLVPLATSVLTLWIGPNAGSDSSLLLRTLVLGGIVGCGTNVFVYYAMGIGQNVHVAWISVVYSIATVVFTVVLIRAFGPQAAGAGLLVASVIRVAAAIVVTRRSFFQHLTWRELLTSTVLPVVVGVACALGLHLLGLSDALGWTEFLAKYAAFSAVVLGVMLLFTSMVQCGRAILASVFHTLRARARS